MLDIQVCKHTRHLLNGVHSEDRTTFTLNPSRACNETVCGVNWVASSQAAGSKPVLGMRCYFQSQILHLLGCSVEQADVLVPKGSLAT